MSTEETRMEIRSHDNLLEVLKSLVIIQMKHLDEATVIVVAITGQNEVLEMGVVKTYLGQDV
ncbi:hypothetical protein DGG96_17375 [Legionella qingyii]|uniref:Uncharacterized protein n=1 Tax=Legionella qingyii TaxID=2184757 RepID=A0A317TZ69_9GAMM|nr:hypothetical protein [Legionella qingyii]PWY54379.1 hypothetical protein DGG96_17375 [Legionella qingyii]